MCKKSEKCKLYMKNMQNNMYKICNENANNYAEYVNHYVT